MTPEKRQEMVKLRDHADRLVTALALSIASVTTQVESLEASLRMVSDIRSYARDREMRRRVNNLRRAVLAIQFEIEKTAGARDHITRTLAEAGGVTTV